MPFDGRIRLLEEFFTSQQAVLAQFFGKIEMWMPFISGMLEHWSVTCDGCGANPIRGPRFKCEACADYDLCAECFAKKPEVHGGPCAEHEFRCEVADWHHGCHQAKHDWKGMFKGMKGMMKGLWGKGMGKGKGKHQSGSGEPRPCARPECSFQATWHATHCCAACAVGAGHHGPACERKEKEQVSAAAAADTDMEDKAVAVPEEQGVEPDAAKEDEPMMEATNAAEEATRAEQHFSSHVVMDDGRQLLLEWQSGDDIVEAAKRFVMQHGLGEEHLQHLVAAMQSTHQGAGHAAEEEGKAPADPAPPAEDGKEAAAAAAPGPFEEQISQIKDMGFVGITDEELRTLLQALGGDVQQAVEALMAHLQQ
eukprot:CAMPEP_0204535050 /NCGR_PEP_ID=MMETSP0661-20131031/13411_1 /ASSEMBLY_ACC=CAM_ASM_000606 /TAXON_ID=109239 /ORGANISM="Alexandrium margalefi, Strain AMGDE01CS-322" /LENGTH=365 /DNA_ID=CAMNT_0051541527 /DNA_START=1 /DNA_END=1098 /DNA_ORIENTATION=-